MKYRDEEHLKTTVDVPEGFIFTYTNSRGKEKKIDVWGAIFRCHNCFQQQELMLNPEPGKMQIIEHHAQECPYFEEWNRP